MQQFQPIRMNLIKYWFRLPLFLSLIVQLLQQICSFPLTSIYCPANAGTGASYNSCQSCDQVFALDNTASPNCQPYPPAMYVYEASSTSGLNVIYSSSTQTPCGSITTLNGWFSTSDTVDVKYPGITRPYQAIKIIFGLVSRGSWSGSQQIEMNFANTGELRSQSIMTRNFDLLGQCSADNTDFFYRIVQNYNTYTTENTELVWNIKLNGISGTTNGEWGVTEILMVIRACDLRCITCTTSTVACTSCTTSGTYQSFLVSSNSTCVAAPSCPTATYADTSTHVCENCNSTNCLTCSTRNVCTNCSSGFYLLSTNTSCVSSCPTGYYGNSAVSPNACTVCPNECTQCSSATSCSACTTNGTYQSFLNGTTCITGSNCPTATYPDSTTHICASCNTSCSACSITKDNCTSCAATLYYLSNICYSNCPTGYYENTGNGQCTVCDPKCTACDVSSTNCSACTINGTDESFLSGASCVGAASCPTGTYPDTTTHICTTCNISCSACQNTINNCTSCNSTLYYLTNICYLDCPTGYYENTGNGQCTLCDPKCTICGTSATSCSACTTNGTDESFLTGSSCVAAASCPSGTYPDATTHICTACNTSCATCSITIDNCTSCTSTLYYLSNICYSNCPTGYYENTGNGQCTLCDLKCTVCEISGTNCSACTTNGTLESFLIAASFSCVASTSCLTGTYPEPTTHICTGCNSSCVTCFNNANNCTQCATGLYILNNICYADCPLPYYQSAAATKQCLICNSYCTACDVSSTNCSACVTNGTFQAYLKVGNLCVVASSCPAGTYPEAATHICTTCNTSCATCMNNADNCTACTTGLYILNNICYSDCPITYYESAPAVKQCLSCNSRCLTCDISSTNCSSCTTNGTFQSYLNASANSCVVITSCATGYFGNVLTHVCEVCNGSCSTCTGTTNNCTWCTSPLYLLNNICYTVCPTTYYGNAGICILCHNLCQTCFGTAVNQCFSCKTVAPNQAFYLSTNKTCYVTCPTGYFPIVATHICQKCDISCTSCTNSPSPCQSCNSSYSYFNQTCLASCPNGYYSAVSLPLTYKLCQPCVEQCLTCFGGTNTQCNSCNFDLMVKKSGSNCKPNCSAGWGDIQDSQFCVYCNVRCVSCFNTANNCTACKTTGTNQGYMIITNTTTNTGNCYGVCPTGYFANITTRFCDLCTSPCKTCSKNTNNCTSCVNGTYFLSYNFSCYSVCPDGYFINGTLCSPCENQCKICTSASDNCTLCNNALPTYLYNFTCLYNCPTGYYKNNDTATLNYTCEQCDTACSACTGKPNPCSACAPNYFYYLKTCNTSCYEPGYFADTVTWSCLHCDIYCVRMSLSMAFQTVLEEAIVVTFKFTEDLDWSTFPMKDFQEFSFSNPFFTLDMFSFQYTILSSNTYQIKITPKLYIFMYNLQVTVNVMPMPDPNFQALNTRSFHDSVYNQTTSIIWSHIKAPLTDTQKQSIISMMNVTAEFQKFTNRTGVRQIVQSGIFAWIFPGVQITSAVILVNGIIPQQMYEGIRIMATAIFYQVPSWEKNAQNSRQVFNSPIQDLVQNTLNTFFSLAQFNDTEQTDNFKESSVRLTLEQTPINMPADWRFKRAGFSTFFALDLYMQILLLVVVWIVLLIFLKCIYPKEKTHPNVRKVYIAFHKIHEVSLMYVTIALVLQWLYFQKQTQTGYKWISFILCLVLLVYFLAYQLYIYYDMFQYPEAHINTRSYLMYATKYGSFLNKIRYEEYDINQKWSPRVWFRPYNYHILSFYKKFMMIFALPIFHQLPYTQATCLITLQVLEIIRFIVTWPFRSKFRNMYRIFLEVVLLLIFIIVMITQHLASLLMKNDPTNIEEVSKWFNLLGWLGLILVLVFNCSVFIIAFIDMVRLCRKGDSVVQMDEIRKEYYWQKVKKYEDENEDIDVNIVSKWVKLGNLREEENMHEQSKFITVKVQKLRIQKTSNFYSVHITHASDMRIKKQGFVYEENSRRLQIKDKVRKFMEVSKDSNKQFYDIFTAIYDKYKVDEQFEKGKKDQIQPLFEKPRMNDNFEVVVETYLKINLNEYPNGGRVYFYKSMIKHVISLFLNEKKLNKIKVEERIEGLPLSNRNLWQTQRKNKDRNKEKQYMSIPNNEKQ